MAMKSKVLAQDANEFFVQEDFDSPWDLFNPGAEFQTFEDQQAAKRSHLTPAQLDQLERDRAATRAHQEKAIRAEDSGYLVELVGSQEAMKRVVIICREREHRTELLAAYDQEITHLPLEFLTAESVLDSERLLSELHQTICRLRGLPLHMPVETVIEHLQEGILSL